MARKSATPSAPKEIVELVARFDEHRDAYRQGNYNETLLRRYAWTAKLPLSILTDFEEFAVYDCRGEVVRDPRIVRITCVARLGAVPRRSRGPNEWSYASHLPNN